MPPAACMRRLEVWVHLYVSEKLREIEDERLARARVAVVRATLSRKPTAASRLAAAAGRGLRRVGEFLETWGTPAGERAHRDRAALAHQHRHAVHRRMG